MVQTLDVQYEGTSCTVYLILRVYKKTELGLSMRGKQYFTVTRCTCTRTVRVHVLYVYSYKSRTKVLSYLRTKVRKYFRTKVLSYESTFEGTFVQHTKV